MATSTYRPNQALDYVKEMVKRVPVENVQARILNEVSEIMWMAAPWRWTLASFPTFNLVSDTQDYTVAIPSDFVYLIHAYESDGAKTERMFHVEPFLATLVGQVGVQNRLAVIGEPGASGTARVFPKPGTLLATPVKTVYSIYKKQPPVITEQTMHTAGVQVFDDCWWWVYVQGVLWQAYLYSDDERAGTVNFESGGKWQATGQRANFEAALWQMREREKLPFMDPRAVAGEQAALNK